MKLTDKQLQNLKDYFSTQPDVTAVYLYGSFATGNTHKRSDIDLGILFKHSDISLERLGEIYSDLGDLNLPATPEARDVNLDQSAVYLRNVIQGDLIYSKDNIQRIRFQVSAIRKFRDTEHLRQIQTLHMHQRLKEGTYGSGPAKFR